ncbi:signal peptidase I [Curtobacterium sp. MCSS17_008]|uniref:signal peptidase I n=1 Tax=Curtobacterium sp. MCSS17_008 TaxID=2175647 RepID=UPI0021ACD521|nr:signal peptidase I [Curtobacterium sp. MCSS17_008]
MAAAPGRGWRAVLHALVLGIGTGAVLLLAALAVVLVVVPKATGSVPLTVLTESMEPTLPPGTLVVVRPTPFDDIRVGDVVTYQIASGEPAVVTHRVVSVTAAADGSPRLVLQGDANPVADARPVVPAQVRGVVWYSVPGLGYANQLVNASRGWLVPTVAGGLIVYGALLVVLGVAGAVRRRRERRARGLQRGRRRSGTTSGAAARPVGRTVIDPSSGSSPERPR